jgi:peptide/nickel transport system substrate-binding protein
VKKIFYVITVFLVLAMVLAACETAETTPPVVDEAEAPAGEDTTADEADVEETDAEEADVEETDAEEEEVVDEVPEVEAPIGYQEAPMLAEKVEAGELPPVEERLPINPFIVGPGVLIVEGDLPNWQSGTYGGTLQMAHRGEFPPDVFIGYNEGYLAGAGIGISGVQGNVLESFSVSDDSRVFTFKMREGLRWSDGEYVTREDVEFAWFDVMNNEELFPSGVPGKWLSPDTKNPGTLEFIDDWTFTLSFDDPYGSLVVEMAIKGWVGYTDLIKPVHVLAQYHKDYADEAALLAEIEAEGFEDIDAWVNLFNLKDVTNWQAHLEKAIGFPRLYPMLLVELTEGAAIYERNPYYYKVDVEGKQLPYIDRIVTARVDDVEMVNMRAVAGQVDFTRESPDFQQLAVYKEQEAASNYTARLYEGHVNPALLGFNFESIDEAFREVAIDLRFRQAINHAIDRDEINQTIYFGLAQPSAATPSTSDVYDVDKANALLDEMGMTERDANGFRKTPSGKDLVIFMTYAEFLAEHTTINELLTEYLGEIGLNFQYELVSSDLLNQRSTANELMMSIGWAHVPLWATNGWNDWEPNTVEWIRWANPTDEFDGIEPPADARELWEIFWQRAQLPTGSPEDQALYEQMMENYNTNLWRISLFTGLNPLIITNRLCNIPDSGIGIATNYSMEQFFFCD